MVSGFSFVLVIDNFRCMDTEISLKESLAFRGSCISPGKSVFAFVFHFDFANFRIFV